MKPLTAGKLIKLLEKVDPNLIVVASKDSEGNQITEISHINADNVAFKVVDMDGFDVYLHTYKLTPEAIKNGETEKDLCPGAKPCVVLWP